MDVDGSCGARFLVEYSMMRRYLALTSWCGSQSVGIRFRCNLTVQDATNSMGKFDDELEMVEYA